MWTSTNLHPKLQISHDILLLFNVLDGFLLLLLQPDSIMKALSTAPSKHLKLYLKPSEHLWAPNCRFLQELYSFYIFVRIQNNGKQKQQPSDSGASAAHKKSDRRTAIWTLRIFQILLQLWWEEKAFVGVQKTLWLCLQLLPFTTVCLNKRVSGWMQFCLLDDGRVSGRLARK